MRLLGLTLILFAACGSDDPDPHVVGACVDWTDNQGNPFTGMCEAACESPPMSTGKTCDTTAGLNCASFTFGSTDGCCIPDDMTIRFYECQ